MISIAVMVMERVAVVQRRETTRRRRWHCDYLRV